MEINTALILCAGYGKRLNPITLNKPKPLIEINKISLLENTLSLINSLGIKNILINSFYLSEQIENYVDNLSFNLKVIKDGSKILDTGGGILNLIDNSSQDNFLILNPDTIWNKSYLNEIQKMEKFYFENKIKNILLVVEKSRSFDNRMQGDFSLENNILSKANNKNFIFTGCQILNKSIFENYKIEKFSINKIWDEMILKNKLYGYVSEKNFTHLTDIEIYEKLIKINPRIEFSSDFIIAYPGETENDFNDTLNLVKKIKFINSFSFIFSPRPGTKASNLSQIDKEIAKERLLKIQEYLFKFQLNKNKSFINRSIDVLVENKLEGQNKLFGRNHYMNSVIFEGNKKFIGKNLNIKIENVNQNSLFGKIEKNKMRAA